MRHRLAAVVAAAGVPLLVVAACSGDLEPQTPCTDIPPGGCPIARGVACEDPSCEAVYACRPGNVWELAERCPARDGGPPREGGVVDVDAAPSFDASIDAPPGAFGGPGCPSLVIPDCALGLALACGAGCCGCEDLFVCREGGWDLWGVCDDDGIRESGR